MILCLQVLPLVFPPSILYYVKNLISIYKMYVTLKFKNEYRHHFDFIVIICPTLRYNSTYKS